MSKLKEFFRLKVPLSVLLVAVVFSSFTVPLAYADFADLDLAEGDNILVSVEPDPVKQGLDFKVIFKRKDGAAFNLPSVAWPDLSLADLADMNNLSEATKDKLEAFGAKFRSAVDGGADVVRVSVLDQNYDSVATLPFLVSSYPYLEQSADAKTLTVTFPVTEEGLDIDPAKYLASVELFSKDGEDISGDVLFEVTKLFNFNFDFNWGGFVLPGDEAIASDIKLSTNTVKPGATMSVTVYDQNGQALNLAQGWDLQIKSVTAVAVLNIGSYSAGDLTKEGAGVYSFEASNKEGKHKIVLVNDAGKEVDSAEFTVKAGFVLDLNGAGLLDPFANLDDVFAGFEGFADIGADVGVVAQPENNDYPCVDVDDAYWGHDILKKLIADDLYPVIRSILTIDVTCRPVAPVLRKEFTAWLLNAYRPDVVANIDQLDLSDMPFPDVDKDDPYAAYILKAYALGIINGNPDGTFKPDSQINRAEVLKILLRSSNLFNATDAEVEDLMEAHAADAPLKRFKDTKDENAWYYPYLYYGVVKNIIQGYADGKAKMEQGVIYGEAAKILYLSLKLEGKIE